MVRWLDPHQLVDTAARVVASGFFSAYTDSRELQALTPAEVFDRSAGKELWIDYVADLGDGWNSTYSVAYLLAQPELELAGSAEDDGQPVLTRRGDILVMGGDQVYPVPTRTQYENRLLGPYRAAMPVVPDDGAPELFAIPGSHDWYDGLLNFTSIFCRQRVIGGRRTRQTRSYFAVRLPHRWSLWGVDLQFGDYLDEAQVAFFTEAARDAGPGERIIICQAKEVDSGRRSTEVASDRSLAYLEREVVRTAGANVALYLKSGRHHYCRYEAEDGAQVVTAGGGGAFLHPTHDLPERTDPPGDDVHGRFRLKSLFPSRSFSRRLRKRVWLLPAYNLPLAAALGTLQVLLVFMLDLHRGDNHVAVGWHDLAQALWESPVAFLLISLVILVFGAMIRLAHDAEGLPRLLIGLGHTTLQFGGLGLVIVISSRLSAPFGHAGMSLAVFLALVFVLGGIGGVLGVSGYLWGTNCFGFHANEAYAPLHHADQKNFLRLHFTADGRLILYPVGIDRVVRQWEFRPEGAPAAPWLAPSGEEPAAHLIEAPVPICEPASAREGTALPGRSR